MVEIPLTKSELKQIQSDILAELTTDLSIDHLDLDLGGNADDGTVRNDAAVWEAFFVTGCDVEMKINFAVFTGNSTIRETISQNHLKLNNVVFLLFTVLYTPAVGNH